MRSPAMIACGLSLAHRAKFGRLKKKAMSGIKVLSASGIRKDPEPVLAVMPKRALKFRF